MLQEYYLIGLDVFKKSTYPKTRCNLTAWLSLLATEDMSEVEALIEEYPWLEEIYREMAEYMYRPEEVLNMFSEALSILDSNTVRLMIDEMNEKLAEQGEKLAEQGEKLAEQGEKLAEQGEKLAEQGEQLAEQKERLAEKDGQLAEKDKRILELERQLAELKG
jgi:septal ring factor EnvC (AmiA/AmiB activator)